MDLDDLKHTQECYKCGCLYIESDEEIYFQAQFLCKGCKKLEENVAK